MSARLPGPRSPRAPEPFALMRLARRLRVPLAAGLLAGCTPAPDAASGPTCAEDEVADGETCVPRACGVGSWGDLEVADDAIFVDGSAAGGDGSEADPLTSLQAGIDLAVALGGGRVLVASGRYLEHVVLGDGYKDLEIQGRCTPLVTLDAAGEGVALTVAGDHKRPGASFAGLTLTGGADRGVDVSSADLALVDVVLEANGVAGLVATEGADVRVQDSVVRDTAADSRGRFGRGVDVEGAATLEVTGSLIEGNPDVGLFAAGTDTLVTLTDTTVVGTTADGAGEGLDVQDGASLTGTGVSISGCVAAGVLVSDGEVTLSDSSIAGTVPDADGVGAGVEVVGGGSFSGTRCALDGNLPYGVAANGSTLTLVDSSITGGGRGAELELGARLSASGTRFSGNMELGLKVDGTGTAANLDACQVVDAVAPAGGEAKGVEVTDGATFTASGSTFSGNAGAGLYVVGVSGAVASATLSSCSITDNLAGENGAGAGIGVGEYASFAGDDLTIAGNVGRGIYAVGTVAGTTTVDLRSSTVSGSSPLPEGIGGDGLDVGAGASIALTDVVVEDNAGRGLLCEGTATVDGSTVRGNAVYGVEAGPGGSISMLESVVDANAGVGVLASGDESGAAAIDLADSTVSDTRRDAEHAFATGIASEAGSAVVATDVTVSGSAGPALYAAKAALACTRCTLSGNALAGAVAIGTADLELTDVSVSGALSDAEFGGGFGVYVLASGGSPTLSLLDSWIDGQLYAAVWLDGPGSYVLSGSTLTGGAGVASGASAIHGNAVFAENGVTAWDGSTGLLIADDAIVDASTIAVLLDESSAAIEGGTWSGNAADLRQQRCDSVTALSDVEVTGLAATICPTSNVLTAYDLALSTLYLPTATTAE